MTPLLPGRAYWLKLASQTVSVSVRRRPNMQINVNTLEHLAAKTLELNAIGVARGHDRPRASCSKPMPSPAARSAGSS